MPATATMPCPATGQIAVVLLAAGRSRRMGGADKLMLPTGSPHGAEPLLRRAARLYLELGLPLTVVVRPDHAAPAAALAGLDVAWAINPLLPTGADDGQQASVLAGLRAAPAAAGGVLVALADQPLLTPADIAALLACFSAHAGGRIVVPRHAGQRGNPVILPGALARALAAGGVAPRAHIDAHPDQVIWFEAETDHFTRDIDTPEDAARLLPPQPAGVNAP